MPRTRKLTEACWEEAEVISQILALEVPYRHLPNLEEPTKTPNSTDLALTCPPSSNGPTWENQAREQNQVGMITVGPWEVNT